MHEPKKTPEKKGGTKKAKAKEEREKAMKKESEEKAKLTYARGVEDLEVTNLQGQREKLAEAANVQFLVKPLTGNQLKNSEKNNFGLLRIK